MVSPFHFILKLLMVMLLTILDMIKSLCIGEKCEEMETLFNGKRNYYSHQSSTFAILAISNKL
jgi:hypothetical protein